MIASFLNGVYPPMLTPFTENGTLDLNAHAFNIQRWNAYNLKGYLVLGSNSETIYLTEQEKLDLIKQTVQHKSPDKYILAGTGMESTRETVRLTNLAASLGVNAALILTPFYYKSSMTTESLIDHFQTVADEADIPIMIYNVPKFTQINVSPELVAQLSQHPNIIGMKDSHGSIEQLKAFVEVADKDFSVLAGTASTWFGGLKIGINGAIMALANIAPQCCIDLEFLFSTGNLENGQNLHERMSPVNTAITGTYGIPGLKHAATLLGWKGGFVRKPLSELSEIQKKEIETILINAQLLS
jgi:4-hydroxy-2-oxoglutarate aldolase